MKKLNLLVIVTLTMLIAACSGVEENSSGDEELTKTVNVETETITPQTFESHVRVVGNVETSDDIMISSEVSGRVVEHYVDVGETMAKGQAIMKIDDAKLLQEKARLEAITAQARENYERLQRIYEEESIGSEMDYLNARYNYEQSQSSLESINIDLQNTTITAPFAGKVENLVLEEGEMASPGVEVVRLIGSEKFIVSAGIPARYADVIQLNDEVKVWFDAQRRDTLTGQITYVAGSITSQNRTFRIEVLLPGQRNRYKVDMIANLRLNTLTEEEVIIVSEEFIYNENNEFVTYVVAENEQGKAVAERRVVTLGPNYQSNVIIRDGLDFGDNLITTGSAFLNDGMRLNIIEPDNKTVAVY
ncbi:MAG: efflux RND transporter periplasmic adaptor subunit [Balneolaceae bacterium]